MRERARVETRSHKDDFESDSCPTAIRVAFELIIVAYRLVIVKEICIVQVLPEARSRRGPRKISAALIFRACLGVAGDRYKDRTSCRNLSVCPAAMQHSCSYDLGRSALLQGSETKLKFWQLKQLFNRCTTAVQ